MVNLTEKETKASVRQAESLSRARFGKSLSNYPAIMDGFIKRGIPEDNILPRVNVFTYQAWQAQGRQVRKGEKGVRVCVFVDMDKKVEDKDTGETKIKHFSRPRSTTVFHITQTDEKGAA